MSNRSETNEYNIYYDIDCELEYEDWQPLAEVRHFYDALGKNPEQTAEYAQASIVKRTRVVFHTDWEYLENGNDTGM